MKIERLDHLVLAVEQLGPALEAWQGAFDLAAEPPVRPAGTHMELAFLNFEAPGGSFVELVRPTEERHRVARFLAERGEGMFSLSLQVPDLDAAVAELRARGLPVSDPEAGVLPETRVARIPRASGHGVAVQLIERG